jgi:D-serine deaminase-like pyridoxal phosphate-dependent protein
MKETYIVNKAEKIASPSLLLYKKIIEENTKSIINQADGTHRLWPHVKSHKMKDFVALLQSFGITRFKCATIAEAEMLALQETKDILLAYSLVGPSIDRFVSLSFHYPNSNFWAIGDSLEMIEALGKRAFLEGLSVQFLIDVNMGMNRTGVNLEDLAAFYEKCATFKGICLKGLHCYDGNHHESSIEKRCGEVQKTDHVVFSIRDSLIQKGYDCSVLVMGGSPSFPCHAMQSDVFLSPGTIFIHDYGYEQSFPDFGYKYGATLLSRVISLPASGFFTLDLGYKAIASDPIGVRGKILNLDHAISVFQNEEHWVFKMEEGYENERPNIGDVLYVVPTHICPTSALYEYALIIENGEVVDRWEVTARNRTITY